VTVEDRNPHKSRSGVRPLDALDSHVQLIRALRTPGIPTRLSIFEGANFSRNILQHGRPPQPAAEAMGGIMARELDAAATIVVTDRMLSLVLKRMADVQFGQPLGVEDPPFRAGYVVLPRPVVVPNDDRDFDPDTLTGVRPDGYAAFDGGAWVPSMVARTSSAADRQLYREMGWPEQVSGVSYLQLVSRPLGLQIAHDHEDDVREPSAELVNEAYDLLGGITHLPIYVAGWAFDTSWDPANREPSFVLTSAGEFERRFWLSLFRTLGEEVIAPVHFPRRTLRGRARNRAQLPEVVVCDLRRLKRRHREEPTEDGGTIMWSHRWRVREHERTLHRGTPQERKITVREHVKGPDSMPLIEKDRVYRLGR
jgi:hypothetical protein